MVTKHWVQFSQTVASQGCASKSPVHSLKQNAESFDGPLMFRPAIYTRPANSIRAKPCVQCRC